MHTVELLNYALEIAESLGYGVRHEWLGSANGGACEVGGKKWIFVDLALSPMEQLDQVTRALGQDPQIHNINVRGELREYFRDRRAA